MKAEVHNFHWRRQLADAVASLDQRVREARAGIEFEAVRETRTSVNSVQGQLHGGLLQLAIQLDRLAPAAGKPVLEDRRPGS